MTNRPIRIATLASVLMFGLVIAGWREAGRVDPRREFLSLSSKLHITLTTFGPADARLTFFNDTNYGPYQGSIIHVGFPSDPNEPSVTSIGDTAGVYYRKIWWPDGLMVWTLSLSLFYPLAASTVLPMVFAVRFFRRAGHQGEVK